MKYLISIITVLILSSCAEYTSQAQQENMQEHKNHCLQTGLKEKTNALAECVLISTYKTKLDDNTRLTETNKMLVQRQQQEMIQRIVSLK